MLMNMRIARVKKKYSQSELARKSGVSLPTVQKLESGKMNCFKMQYETLLKISKELDLTVSELLQEYKKL